MSPSSWTSLPPHPTPLGCYRTPFWVPRVIQQIPISYLFYIGYCMCFHESLSIHPILSFLPPPLCLILSAHSPCTAGNGAAHSPQGHFPSVRHQEFPSCSFSLWRTSWWLLGPVTMARHGTGSLRGLHAWRRVHTCGHRGWGDSLRAGQLPGHTVLLGLSWTPPSPAKVSPICTWPCWGRLEWPVSPSLCLFLAVWEAPGDSAAGV